MSNSSAKTGLELVGGGGMTEGVEGRLRGQGMTEGVEGQLKG